MWTSAVDTAPTFCDQTVVRRREVKSHTQSYPVLLVTPFEKQSLRVKLDISHFPTIYSKCLATYPSTYNV